MACPDPFPGRRTVRRQWRLRSPRGRRVRPFLPRIPGHSYRPRPSIQGATATGASPRVRPQRTRRSVSIHSSLALCRRLMGRPENGGCPRRLQGRRPGGRALQKSALAGSCGQGVPGSRASCPRSRAGRPRSRGTHAAPGAKMARHERPTATFEEPWPGGFGTCRTSSPVGRATVSSTARPGPGRLLYQAKVKSRNAIACFLPSSLACGWL